MLIKQIVLILITFLGNILAEKLQRQFLETWFQLKKDVLSHSKMPKYKMVKIYKQTWEALYKIFLVIRSFKVRNNGSQGGSLVGFCDSYLSHSAKTDGWMNTKITKR